MTVFYFKKIGLDSNRSGETRRVLWRAGSRQPRTQVSKPEKTRFMLNVNFLLRAATVAAKDNVRVACKNNFTHLWKTKTKTKTTLGWRLRTILHTFLLLFLHLSILISIIICSPGHDGIWTAARAVHGHHEEEHWGVRGAAGQGLWLKGKNWEWSFANEVVIHIFCVVLHWYCKDDLGWLVWHWK